MSTTTVIELAPRHLAVLRAVAAGRAELTRSAAPDVYVDGLCCTDHTIASVLSTAGLIVPAVDAAAGARVPCVLTRAGWHALAVADGAITPKTARPGGLSLASLRRVGSPSTYPVNGFLASD